jgi:uroporphyrinogen decarboxylase
MASLLPVLGLGVADLVVVNGFYESLHLWSPALYRRFFLAPFRAKIEAIHRAGAKVAYNMTSRLLPLRPAFRELGFDVLRYLDPVRGEGDLVTLKREIGDQLCFLGGVNGALTIGRGSEQEIRQATRDAIHALGPGGGLILSAADAIYRDAPWSNVLIMPDEWRRRRDYPLAVTS